VLFKVGFKLFAGAGDSDLKGWTERACLATDGAESGTNTVAICPNAAVYQRATFS